MIEATTSPAARSAFAAAHAQRGQAVADVWHWLFGVKASH